MSGVDDENGPLFEDALMDPEMLLEEESADFLPLEEPLLHSCGKYQSGLRQRQQNLHPQPSSSTYRSEDGLVYDDVAVASLQPPPTGRRRRRLLDRGGAFYQSRGRWGVERLSRGSQARIRYTCGCLGRVWYEWVMGDWFHRLAYKRTCTLMFILFIIYFSIVVIFAFAYLGASYFGREVTTNADGSTNIIAFCDMDIHEFMEALYFSLSTMTTIGYGVSDYYFGGCWTPFLMVLLQVCSAITFDAVAVGLLFHRISRGRKRGRTIIFSDKATIRRIKGVPHLMFRLGELRKYHLIEAAVRCYCVRHERLPVSTAGRAVEYGSAENAIGATSSPTARSSTKPRQMRKRIETTHFVSRQVRLLQPNEDYGSHIWMGLPQVAVHRMDVDSPLVPPPVWYDSKGRTNKTKMVRTAAEATSTSLARRGGDLLAPEAAAGPIGPDSGDIQNFLLDRDAEIIVLVEGTDEGTGAPIQARHSYKPTDIVWNRTFVQCVEPIVVGRREEDDVTTSSSVGDDIGSDDDVDDDNDDDDDDAPFYHGIPVCKVDFSRFHDTMPVPEDCDACAYVPE